jgi:hypothetical protein
MRSEFARAPMGCCTRRCMSCALQNPCFQFRGQHGSDLPQMPAVESRDALLGKSSAPTTRSIVESHHGQIWAEPNDGPGARFSFSIPDRPAVRANQVSA